MICSPPELLKDFIINKSIVKKLEKYNKDNLLNIILYGPQSSGKRTLILAFISHLYNLKSLNTQIKETKIKINNNFIEVVYIQSIYHYEINLYEYGLYDKEILTEFIKEIVASKNVLTNGYKIIFLNNFHKINKNCQLALRAIIEKNINTARFILASSSLVPIDTALLSRFTKIRVPFPKNHTISNYIDSLMIKNLDNSKIISKLGKNLYNIDLCINFPDYKDPFDIFINKIDAIMNNNEDVLFMTNLRNIIYQIHLLNYNISDIIKKYVILCINKKRKNLEKIINKAAECEREHCLDKKYFFFLEKFFNYIKYISI